jgi:hypothetical protein
MKKTDFVKLLKVLSSDLYAYAFVLIPDDLQAGQLIVDSLERFMLSEAELVGKYLGVEDQNSETYLELRLEIYKNIYDLARKRFYQIKRGINGFSMSQAFYLLEFDEKSAIFLKEKMNYSNGEISIIMMKNIKEILGILGSARVKMLEAIPQASI